MRRRNARFAAALCAACAFLVPVRTAEAIPVAIDFELFPASSFYTITGTGTVVVDSSLVRPDVGSHDLDDLISFSLSVSNIPSVPSFTSFSKSDLSGWSFVVVGSPFDPTNFGIEVLNFFMANRPINADGYSFEGISEHVLAVCDGPSVQGSCGSSPRLGIAVIGIGPPHAVPEPGSMLLLEIGLAGLIVKARQRNDEDRSVIERHGDRS